MREKSMAISDNANKPKKVMIDGNSAEQHSLKDQIEADRYTKSNTATVGKKRGLNFAKLRPPGTV
jgi:hypothetical protein